MAFLKGWGWVGVMVGVMVGVGVGIVKPNFEGLGLGCILLKLMDKRGFYLYRVFFYLGKIWLMA